jgi:hypothetical protein
LIFPSFLPLLLIQRKPAFGRDFLRNCHENQTDRAKELKTFKKSAEA